MSGIKLAGEIRTAATGTVERPLAVANRVLELITESFADRTANADPTSPLRIEVTQEKTLDRYNLDELLAALAADPSRYAEIMPYLEREPQYAAALTWSVNLGIPNGQGQLDAPRTTTYIKKLARPYATAQRLVDGQRPVPLEKLFGQEVRPLIHPFTLEPIQGPDALGFDWGTLPDELHKALLWAQLTSHTLWPSKVDAFQHGTELFTEPLPARWQRILEDYLAACAADESNIVTTRYHTADSAAAYATLTGGGHAAGSRTTGQQQNDEAYYQRLLEGAADGTLQLSGMGSSARGGVYDYIAATGMGTNLSSVVALKGGQVTGSGSSGTVYKPRGVNIRVTGMGSSLQVVGKSYRELAEIAGLLH